jgi:hypothetical protein
MPAGKWKIYNQSKIWIGDGTLDLDATSLWHMALFQSTSNCNTLTLATPNFAALTNEVAALNGYSTGGTPISGISWTQSSGTATFTSSAATWTASGGNITSRFAVIYRQGTYNAIISPLLCVCLLDTAPADVTVTSGNTLTISMNLSGIFTMSGANVD